MQERKYIIQESRLVRRSDSVPVPDDEPLFILRAQDRNALATLMAYVSICVNLEHRRNVMKTVNDFTNFRNNNPEKMKEPDS